MESLVFLHFHVEGERHEAAAILKWLHPKDAMVQSKDTRLKILIPVVIERLHGRYYLRPVLVVPSDTSGGVMRKLRTITSQELSEIKSLRVIRAFFWKPVIRTASLSSLRFPRLPDNEAHQSPVEVNILSQETSAELTAEFSGGSSADPFSLFVDQYPSFSSGSARTVLIVGQELNKFSILGASFAVMSYIIYVGLTSGIVHLGVAVGMLAVCGVAGIFWDLN